MSLPGFSVSDSVVGKRLSFDVVPLEAELGLQVELRTTDDSAERVKEIAKQYYEEKSEIREALLGGSTFYLNVYEEDVEVVSNIIANELKFEKVDPFKTFKGEDQKADSSSYTELIQESDLEIDLRDHSFDDLSTKKLDVSKEIKKEIPSGIEEPEFSINTFREFVFEQVKPIVDEGGWRGGNAWLINLGLYELRAGNYQEAAYAFDGARLDLTKMPIFEESSLNRYLNSCLTSLRTLCLNHGSSKELKREHELFITMMERGFVFVPKFLSEPDLNDTNFRLSNNIWIANALTLVAAVANAMDLPSISRSEVDPFGTNTTIRNNHFVLKAAKRLYESDPYENFDQWCEDQAKGFPHLETVDFSELTPEAIIARIFSEIGFEIRDYGGESFEYAEDQKIDISYDTLLSREDALYLAKLVDGSGLETDDIREKVERIREIEADLSLYLLSVTELSDEVIEFAENKDEVELYYLDIDDESIRSVSSGQIFSTTESEATPEVLDEMKELFQKAESTKNSQEKGDLLEELMAKIFNKLIPDTEVLETNVRTDVEEMDLILRNREKTYPWKNLGTPIEVECKNWSSSAGSSVVKVLKGDMESIGPMCETGILVSWKGISDGEPRKNAGQKIREYRQDDIKIIVLEKEDILEIVETGNVRDVFEEKHRELITR